MIRTDGTPTICTPGALEAALAADEARREAEQALSRDEYPADCDPGDCTD